MSGKTTIDWSQLPSDLLLKIAGTLDDEIADRIRFATVCRPWRSASKSSQLPQIRLPWFLLPNNGDDDGGGDAQVRTFFSLSENKLYTLHLPQFRKKLLYCSTHGWLLTVDRSAAKRTASLLNPVTKAQIPLPPLPSGAGLGRCKLIRSPKSSLVAMFALPTGPILCHRHLLGEWTEICAFDHDGKIQKAKDFAYFGDRYFVLGQEDMITSIVDADTGQVLSLIPPPQVAPFRRRCWVERARRRYLVTSSSGEKLFLVISPLKAGSGEFGVFELHHSENKWFKVDNIGRDTLFVDAHRAMALPASTGFNRGRANCIVFFKYVYSVYSNGMIPRLSLVDIGNDSVEELPSCWSENLGLWKCQGWFVPSL